MSYGKSVLLTIMERQILDALVEKGGLKEACESLHINYTAGSQRLFRIRRKYENASIMVKDYERYRMRIQDKSNLYL